MAGMTKAQRSEAAKKAARTRRRNAAKSTRTKSTTRRRRSPRRKGLSEGLAEQFNLSKKDSILNVGLSGAAGGMGGYLISQNVADQKKATLYILAAGVLATVLGKPNVGAGLIGVGVYKLATEQTAMAEGAEFFDPAMLMEDEPLILDEYGYPMLEDDEFALADDEFALADDEFSLSEEEIYSSYFPANY